MLKLTLSCILIASVASVPEICSSPKDPGDFCSQPGARMFYYDPRYKVCQPFQFNGCGGNQNKFTSASECKQVCVLGTAVSTSPSNSPNPVTSDDIDIFVPQGDRHEQWRKSDKCGSNYLIPNGKYTRCNPGCPPNHSCTQGVCCPSKDFVCSQQDDNGTFQDGIEDLPRFGWNHDVKSCVRFSYYGANGNYNNFPNFQSCMSYCKDSNPLKR